MSLKPPKVFPFLSLVDVVSFSGITNNEFSNLLIDFSVTMKLPGNSLIPEELLDSSFIVET